MIFGEYIKHEIPSTTQFWRTQTLGLSHEHYLFGHSLGRRRIKELTTLPDTDTILIPLYILYYVFDNNEL